MATDTTLSYSLAVDDEDFIDEEIEDWTDWDLYPEEEVTEEEIEEEEQYESEKYE